VTVLDRADVPYTLRRSKRARRVTLRIQPGVGLIVTIPQRFAKRDLPEVLLEHDAWIRASLAELEQQTPSIYRIWPPSLLELHAIDEKWRLHFDQPSVYLDSVLETENTLALTIDASDRAGVARAVAVSLKQRARQILPKWVERLGAPHGLSVRRVSVRGQRTVWGSYSSSGTLSLNYKLLFLPARYVDYVILHELAHTRYLDHSPEFWRFLFSLDEDAEHLDATMENVTKAVPPWLELA